MLGPILEVSAVLFAHGGFTYSLIRTSESLYIRYVLYKNKDIYKAYSSSICKQTPIIIPTMSLLCFSYTLNWWYFNKK